MARYAGRSGVIYQSTSGSGSATNVANAQKWSLQFPRDLIEVTALGDSNKTYVQGLSDVKGSATVFYDDSATAALFTSAASSDGVKLYLYPSSTAATKYFYGPAWVQVSDFTVEVSGAVTMQIQWGANGAWGTGQI